MRESLERVTFKVTGPTEAAALAVFHASYGHNLSWESNGIVRAPEVTDAPEAKMLVRSDGERLLLRAVFAEENGDFQARAAGLASEKELVAWTSAAFETGLFEHRLDVTYTKPVKPSGQYIAYSEAGLQNLVGVIGSTAGPLAIETPLVAAPASGKGFWIGPLGMQPTDAFEAASIPVVPDLPALEPWLAAAQVEILKQRSGLRTADGMNLSLAPIRQLAQWVADHSFRQGILQEQARKAAPVSSDADLGALLGDLRTHELHLTRASVSALIEAKDALKTAALEPVKTMQQLRLSLVSALGADIFQAAVSIALVLGGFKLANYENQDVMILVLAAVAVVFLAGFTLRASTQEAVFRETIRMQEQLLPATMATLLPGFHEGTRRALEDAVRSFYWAMSMATPVAFAPIIGVAAFWLASTSRILNPGWFFFVAETVACLVSAWSARRLVARQVNGFSPTKLPAVVETRT